MPDGFRSTDIQTGPSGAGHTASGSVCRYAGECPAGYTPPTTHEEKRSWISPSAAAAHAAPFATSARRCRATWATVIAPDCQQAAGGAYLPAVMVMESEFSLRRGEPIWFERPSDRGHPMRRAFCPACGSPLFLLNGANTAVRVLYAGSVDDPSRYRPSREIYVASAQPWCLLHPDLPHDEGMPRR